MLVRFDDIEVDGDRFELRREGKPVAIEPLVFNLLLHFVQNPERVLSRDDLIEAVWSGRIVSDATVAGAVKSLRKVLGDSGGTQRYIKTLHGRGFRFSAELREPPAPPAAAAAVREPVLAILPLRLEDSMSGYAALAADLVEDLERVFTRIPLLRVSAQASRYADMAQPAADRVYAEIGAHFIIDFSLRERSDSLRLNVQLSDAVAGIHLWSEQVRLSRHDDNLLEQAVGAVIARIEPQLNRAIYQLVRDAGAERNARQLFLEASGLLALKGWREETFLEAATLLRRSIELENDFAHAWAYLALILAFGHRVGLIRDRDQSAAEAEAAAEQALTLDSMDSTVLGFAGCALCDIGMLSRGMPMLKNAIQRNPANGQAWVALGAAHLSQNDLAAAIEHLDHGIRISPLDSRLSVWGALLSLACLLAGEIDKALEQAELATQHDHQTYLPRLVLAAIRLRQQDPGAAASALADAFAIKPDLSRQEIEGIVGKKAAAMLLKLRP